MATWKIEREEDRGNNRVLVTYHNPKTGITEELGRLASDVSDMMIVRWIHDHGGIEPGDRIVLSDGYELRHIGREVRQAA